MSSPFLGEIKLTSFNFPPRGWAFCNGQLLPINQNAALFSIMGTQYGGDGVTTFALPNLQGRAPVHFGNGYVVGESGGETSHTLVLTELPAHVHPPVAQTTANSTTPVGAIFAGSAAPLFGPTKDTTMSTAAVTNVGGSQPHENLPPYLAVSFIVALQGIFPSRS
jgi:microcystin-dependent protein